MQWGLKEILNSFFYVLIYPLDAGGSVKVTKKLNMFDFYMGKGMRMNVQYKHSSGIDTLSFRYITVFKFIELLLIKH
ncbi:MAG: hypothetical protein COA32_08755 [Fluviicola sp.]|nr:MAG: hypothetical protein COA32_08755 [Fluviicola sp.]